MRIEYLFTDWVWYFYNVGDFSNRKSYWENTMLLGKLSTFYDKAFSSPEERVGTLGHTALTF